MVCLRTPDYIAIAFRRHFELKKALKPSTKG